MKKQLLIAFTFVHLSAISFAQSIKQESKIVADTLILSSGYKIVEGQTLKIGAGTMPDGDFKYIRRNSASMFNYTSNSGYQGLANQANAFPRNNSGTTMKVARVEERGNKKRGFVNYVVLGGMIKYEVDIENAIASGEIQIPEEFRQNKSEGSQKASTADELKKFKDLLDSGAITQDEYNAKKKQLLGL